MTYTEAVELAMQGEERGFGFLYQNTYKSKLYLALQYMKNEEDAKDVLQDAYIKAFSRLGSLQDPEKFQAWLGQIVANTAKNALVKKNPVLFSDIAPEENDEPFEFRIEDEDISRQPELAYTKEETRQLVRELMDSLSEEQRICVLMFHIEGASIKEIAEALDCSENTVKSRLNYGRKNIKRKAEDLQKKGYKLYGLAPLPLLLLLFRKDAYAMSAEKSFTGAGGEIADQVFKEFPFTGNGASASRSDTAGQQNKNQSYADSAGTSGAGKAAGAGLLHTAAGKALVAVVAVAVIGGTVFGVTRMNHNKANEQPDAEVTLDDIFGDMESEAESEIVEAESEPVETEEDVNQPQAVSDEVYPDLLEGELTKEEFEFVLAYGPEELTEAGLTDTECEYIRNQFCEISNTGGLNMLTDYGIDSAYQQGYSVSEINRLFSVFTDYRFTEDNYNIDGDIIWVYGAELNFTATAEITDASYTDDEMTVNFHYHKEVDDYEFSSTTDTDKTAILHKNENGNFQIVTISEAGSSADTESSTEQDVGEESDPAFVKALYKNVLQEVSEGKYTFPGIYGSSVEGYYYFLADTDGDGVLELVVGAQFESDAFYWYDCIVFDSNASGSVAHMVLNDGDICVMSAYIPSDGNGFLGMTDFSRGTGQTEIQRVTTLDDALSVGAVEYDFITGSDENTEFTQANTIVEWTEISDYSGLDQIN